MENAKKYIDAYAEMARLKAIHCAECMARASQHGAALACSECDVGFAMEVLDSAAEVTIEHSAGMKNSTERSHT